MIMTTHNKQELELLLADLKARYDIVLNDEKNSSLTFVSRNGERYPTFPAFAKEVSDLLLEYLSSADKDVDTEFIVGRIDSAIPAEIVEEQQGRVAASTIWTLVLEVVYHFPFDHEVQDELVALVMACTIQPEEDLKKSLSDITDQWKSLRDLPYLDSRIREIWNGMWPGISWEADDTDTADEAEADKRRVQWELWLRLNAFVARLLALNIQQTQMRYVEILWSLRDTVLEHNRENPKQIEREVTLCSALFQYAGRQLHSLQQEGTLNEWEIRALYGGPLYTGRPGLYQERWEFWQNRLLEIVDSGLDISADAKQLAQQTAAKMKEIQSTSV